LQGRTIESLREDIKLRITTLEEVRKNVTFNSEEK